MYRAFIDLKNSKGTIDRNIYGHFSEHIGGVFYDGLWVGEDSKVENIRGFRKALVESFKKINPPVLRWPGGCFAETYDWRDGIGPREKRPTRVNWWYYEDGRLESNHVGTHEFMDFCKMVGAEPYVAANMTTTTPMHIRDWIEYCNFPAGTTTLANERAENGAEEPFGVKYWGIGNENWGGGGCMLPEQCADEYHRYTTVCRPVDNVGIKYIMCGANATDVEWTRRIMKRWSERKWPVVKTWGLSLHYYNSALSGSDEQQFEGVEDWNDEIFRAHYIGHVIDEHRAAMDEFDPERKVKLVVDEWGNWHKDGSGPSKGYNLFEQQSSMRDAVVAAMELNLFNDRCDIIGMANLAQLCNNLHSLYLTGGENFVETPNYHVFDMYKGHQDGVQRPVVMQAGKLAHKGFADISDISASASVKDGVMTLTLVNLDLENVHEIELSGLGGSIAGEGEMVVLHHENANTCNTFEEPRAVVPYSEKITLDETTVVKLPAASVAAITVKIG
ncbi:MAG: alpha-N-arabinofuranosidase [Clostridia bacterium]|nr:alpha-N-arabinofuranosidase [Clostridia bacterium]